MALTTLSVAVSVLVLKVHHTSPSYEVPGWVRRHVLSHMSSAMHMDTRHRTDQDAEFNTSNDKIWRTISQRVCENPRTDDGEKHRQVSESTAQQQQRHKKSSLGGHAGVASLGLQTDGSSMQDRSTIPSPWTMRRLFRQQQQGTTTTNSDDVICTDGERRPTADDDTPTAQCGPRVRWETEWTRVAEVLDRFFFFVFMALLLAPTVTILGFVRLFKPEL